MRQAVGSRHQRPEDASLISASRYALGAPRAAAQLVCRAAQPLTAIAASCCAPGCLRQPGRRLGLRARRAAGALDVFTRISRISSNAVVFARGGLATCERRRLPSQGTRRAQAVTALS